MKIENFTSMRAVGDIPESDVKKIYELLNGILADEYGLFTKTLNYHWNITGPRFHSLHNFLEEHYQSLLGVMDDIAERVRVIGETPHSTVKEFNQNLSLDEKKGSSLSSNEMIADLFASHMKIQTDIKNTVSEENFFNNDPGTEDFLVGLLQKHEMMSWMLRSHLD